MNNIIDKSREGFGEIQIESISEKEGRVYYQREDFSSRNKSDKPDQRHIIGLKYVQTILHVGDKKENCYLIYKINDSTTPTGNWSSCEHIDHVFGGVKEVQKVEDHCYKKVKDDLESRIDWIKNHPGLDLVEEKTRK